MCEIFYGAARRRCRIAKGRKHSPLGTCSRNSSKEIKRWPIQSVEKLAVSRARKTERCLCHERKREPERERRNVDATKVAAMRQNLNTASSSLARWCSNGRYRCPYYHDPSLIQSCAIAACICTYSHASRSESPSIIRARGSERAKVVLQNATERRHDIGQSTDACVVARRLAAILESCQQTSHCALNP